MELSYDVYRPEDYAKGIIQIMHGMEEHRLYYKAFAQYLCKQGFVVITYDHRGHGENGKETLGFFGAKDGWDHLVEDAHQISQIVRQEYPPETPFFLFGHSMGSMVAQSYLKRYDNELKGLILCGVPKLDSMLSVKLGLINLICKVQGDKSKSVFLQKQTTGRYNKKIKNSETKFDWLSYDKEYVKTYCDDLLCGFGFTNRGYYDLVWGMKYIKEKDHWNIENKDLPILVIYGEDDPVTGGEKGRKKTIARLKNIGYQNIEEIIYPKMRHAILNEVSVKDVYEETCAWINKAI